MTSLIVLKKICAGLRDLQTTFLNSDT